MIAMTSATRATAKCRKAVDEETEPPALLCVCSTVRVIKSIVPPDQRHNRSLKSMTNVMQKQQEKAVPWQAEV